MSIHWTIHLGIHVARFFWVAIIALFACCLMAYLRHQKISAEELSSVKYLEPRRITGGQDTDTLTGLTMPNLKQPPVCARALIYLYFMYAHAVFRQSRASPQPQTSFQPPAPHALPPPEP